MDHGPRTTDQARRIRGTRALPALAIVGMCSGGWVVPRESFAGETRKLTEKDNRRREPVRLGRDDTIEVRLPEQRGTGYAWRKATDSTQSLELVGEPVATKGELPGYPGLVEYRLFRFRVPRQARAKESKRELKLIYTRPGSDRAAKTFIVPIELREPNRPP